MKILITIAWINGGFDYDFSTSTNNCPNSTSSLFASECGGIFAISKCIAYCLLFSMENNNMLTRLKCHRKWEIRAFETTEQQHGLSGGQ